MGVLLIRGARRPLLVLALALLAGCVAHPLRMRVAQPAGGELRVLSGPFTAERALPIPFIASFQPMGDAQSYAIVLHVPEDVARRLGGRGAVDLPGVLEVHPPTELARASLAELPIDEDRLGRLLRGETAETWWEVHDPNDADGRLAKLTLHGTSR